MLQNLLSIFFLVLLFISIFQILEVSLTKDEASFFLKEKYFLGKINGDFSQINLPQRAFFKNQFCDFLFDGSLFCFQNNKVFISKDKKHFNLLGKIEGKNILVKEMFLQNNFIYLLADDGKADKILLSKDKGKSFQEKINFGEKNFHSLFVFPQNPNHLLLAKDDLIFESENQGFSWKVKNKFSGRVEKIGKLENGIFVLVERQGDFQILESRDFGASFFKVFSTKDSGIDFGIKEVFASGDSFYILFTNNQFGTLKEGRFYLFSPPLFEGEELTSFTLDQENGKIIYLGGKKGIYISLDEGGSWERFPLSFFERRLSKVKDLKSNPIFPQEFLIKIESFI
jgi:hypothetical protein